MLFGSTMLEIAISLFFIYLLLSLICSAVNEWLAGVLGLRAKTLREGIANLLDDPDSEALAAEFYKHPLIAGLSRGRGKKRLPSYIPSSTFVRALLDITELNNEPVDATDPNEEPESQHRLIALYKHVQAKLSQSESVGNSFELALLNVVEEAGLDQTKLEQAATTLKNMTAARLALTDSVSNAAAKGVENQLAKEMLETVQGLDQILSKGEEEAAATLASIQTGLESYFDDAMDRVSGWYKRRTQAIIIVLALAVSGFLNVDSVAITQNLAANGALRATIVAAAGEAVQNGDGTLGNSLDEALKVKDELAELGLPIGWQTADIPDKDESDENISWSLFLLSKVLGLIVTAVAVSLGAPFWFDLLNKLVNLRMAGQKS